MTEKEIHAESWSTAHRKCLWASMKLSPFPAAPKPFSAQLPHHAALKEPAPKSLTVPLIHKAALENFQTFQNKTLILSGATWKQWLLAAPHSPPSHPGHKDAKGDWSQHRPQPRAEAHQPQYLVALPFTSPCSGSSESWTSRENTQMQYPVPSTLKQGGLITNQQY